MWLREQLCRHPCRWRLWLVLLVWNSQEKEMFSSLGPFSRANVK